MSGDRLFDDDVPMGRYMEPLERARPRRAVDDGAAPTGRDHPDSSRDAAARVLPRTGTIRRAAYDYVRLECGGRGAISEEIQQALVGRGLVTEAKRHQTGSAAVSGLKRDGWLVPALDDDGHPVRRSVGRGTLHAEVLVAVPEHGA